MSSRPGSETSGGATIGGQGRAGPLLQAFQDPGTGSRTVMGVVGHEPIGDPVMGQEFACPSSVFGRDKIDSFENADSSEGNILQISDGCGHDI